MKRKYVSTYTGKDYTVKDVSDSIITITSFASLITLVGLVVWFNKKSDKQIFFDFVFNTGVYLIFLFGFLLFLGL